MNTVTIILVMLAIIVMCGAVIYSLIKMIQKNKKEIQSLNNELNSARENVKQLTDFIRNSDKIRKEEKEIAEKIKEAKTDEEVHNIINDIIALNNNRVQNN
jgi:predicted Holliday junction resolvase-like endonuclease